VLCHSFIIAAINLLDSTKNLSILGRPKSVDQYTHTCSTITTEKPRELGTIQ